MKINLVEMRIHTGDARPTGVPLGGCPWLYRKKHLFSLHELEPVEESGYCEEIVLFLLTTRKLTTDLINTA